MNRQTGSAAQKICRLKIVLLILMPFLLGFIFLLVGKYHIKPVQLMQLFLNKLFGYNYDIPDIIETVIFNVRLPRIIAAFIIGGSLAAAGSAYQGIFNNPLVSPDILGATSGASFGAALAIVMSWNVLSIQISSFVFGIFAVGITCFAGSRIRHNNQTLVLILSGILTGSVFNSFVTLSKFLADSENKLPAITFWLMGSLASIKTQDIYFIAIPGIISLAALYLMRWSLNVLSFGDEEAKTMGVNTTTARLLVILFSTLLTSSSVAVSGIIGWVGLVVPNLARFLVGSDYRILMPVSFFMGGSFLLIVDTIARTIFPVEVPLGILISLIGAPFYIWLMARSRRGWR